MESKITEKLDQILSRLEKLEEQMDRNNAVAEKMAGYSWILDRISGMMDAPGRLISSMTYSGYLGN